MGAGGEVDPVEEHLITDLAAVKTFSDPLRIRILDAIADQALSAREIAGAVGFPQHKLYYHLGLLERHRLLRVTVLAGERRYRSIARRFRIERSRVEIAAPLTEGDVAEGIEAVFALFLHETGRDLRAAVAAGAIDLNAWSPHSDALLLRRERVRLTPEQASAFHARLQALIAEFATAEDGPTGARSYAYLLGLHPVAEADGGNGQAVGASTPLPDS